MRSLARCVGLTGLAGLLALAAGCGRHGKSSGGGTPPPSQSKLVRSVELAEARQEALSYAVETVGTLEAEATTEIAAGVTGVVDEVLFREGQWVEPDTLLVKIDQRRYLTALEVARANEKRAEVNSAMARDLDLRAQRLAGASTEEEKAQAALKYRLAEAELTAARASRAIAEHNLNCSRVRPPYPGQINQRKVAPGTYLQENTVLATIADLRRLRLVGWVPEKAAPTARELLTEAERRRGARLVGLCLAARPPLLGLAGLAADASGRAPVGFKVEFTLPPFPQQTFTAHVFYLSSVASPDTRQFEFKAEVVTDGLSASLKPGASARVRVPLRGNPRAVVVPETSVRASERGFLAFVPKKRAGKNGEEEYVAEARPVDLGYRSPGWVEVLQGVRAGEWVVARGADALENGTPIQFPEGNHNGHKEHKGTTKEPAH